MTSRNRRDGGSYHQIPANVAGKEIPIACAVGDDSIGNAFAEDEGLGGGAKIFEYDEDALHNRRIEKKYESVLWLESALFFTSGFYWFFVSYTLLPGALFGLSTANLLIKRCCNPWKSLLARYTCPKPIPQTLVDDNGIRHVEPAEDGYRYGTICTNVSSTIVGNKIYKTSPVGGTVFIPYEDLKDIEVGLEWCSGFAITQVVLTMGTADESKFVESGYPTFGHTFARDDKNGTPIIDSTNSDDTTCILINGLRDPYQFKKHVLARSRAQCQIDD